MSVRTEELKRMSQKIRDCEKEGGVTGYKLGYILAGMVDELKEINDDFDKKQNGEN